MGLKYTFNPYPFITLLTCLDTPFMYGIIFLHVGLSWTGGSTAVVSLALRNMMLGLGDPLPSYLLLANAVGMCLPPPPTNSGNHGSVALAWCKPSSPPYPCLV